MNLPNIMPAGEILLRLLFAMLAGAAVGMERGRFRSPAGLRTCMIVAAGACSVMILDEKILQDVFLHAVNAATLPDPSRIGAQVVSGIGFLGAGAILYTNSGIRGLTTAATLWAVAGLGLAFGSGQHLIGLMSTVIILMTLTLFRHVTELIQRFSVANPALRCNGFTIEGDSRQELLLFVRERAERLHVQIRSLSFTQSANGKITIFFVADFSGVISSVERTAFARAMKTYTPAKSAVS